MLRIIILLAIYAGLTWGAPQSGGNAATLGGRIVGGEEADIADYPWTVSLQYHNMHSCGGVIISSTWILSAAHCVVGETLSVFTIRAGSSAQNIGGQLITLSRIIIHADYDMDTTDYDITAIELSVPFAVRNASPIPIAPATSAPVTGATVTITGWGLLSEGGQIPEILHVVQVPVVNQTDCELDYGSKVTDRMFCAGEAAGGKDSCSSDSGGPAVIDGLLAGLVSWGGGCARPGNPGVYTNLPVLRPWISDNTGI